MSIGEKLNKQQRTFCRIYVEKYMCDKKKATAAAREAGYTDGKGLRNTAYRLIQRDDVKAYISELTDTNQTYQHHLATEKQIEIDINQEYIESIAFLARVRKGEEKDTFGLEPSVRDKTAAAKELIRIKERKDAIDAKVADPSSPLANTGPFMIVPCYGAPEDEYNGSDEG